MNWSADFFKKNRKSLAGLLGGGLVVAPAYRQMQRRNDMAHDFSQDANFWYLTGVDEPDWLLIYDGMRDYAWLVRPERSDVERLFDGGAGDAEIVASSGVDEIVAASDAEALLRQLARRHSTAYAAMLPSHVRGGAMVFNPSARTTTRMLERILGSVQDCSPELSQLRAVKRPAEIAAIERAVRLTAQAFSRAKEMIMDCDHEYEIEALIGYEFRRMNAKHAYAPIVAASKNACTLHYTRNDSRIRKGSAVLIDAGAELDGYCADITRTYVRGQATKRYQTLHAALEAAHIRIIDLLGPSIPLSDYAREADTVMKQMLCEVGLLKSVDDECYRQYFPHAVSHGLGIDVHDSLGGSRTLKPGMVLTVEPGIYLPDEKIGIRIEDNILITESGVRNLSQGLSTSWD